MGRQMGSTKERIMLEALRLFSEKGYDSVKLSEISERIGIKTPSLYKHYESKQAIYDTLMEMSQQGFAAQMDKLKVDFRILQEKRKTFVLMPEEGQVKIMQELFLNVFDDEMPRLFRHFMKIEQFRHPEFAVQLNRRYVDSQFSAFEALMQEFIDAGVYRDGNAHAMAVQYASPVILCIDICDREPERKEEAMEMIAEHLRQFNAVYRLK